jgi:predicted aldo/keto reductase-like oxidoreductase
MDVDQQAGKRGLKYAASKGLAVVVMEPLRGGRLTKQPPESVARLWASAPQKRTPAEWALQWVLNQAEVSSTLSGMSNMDQVIENVAIADRSKPGSLTAEELTLIEQVREAYRKTNAIPCTGCQYCMPCPNGVEIPRIFELYNDAVMYNDTFMTRYFYRGPAGLKEEQRADKCLECEQCLETCPQMLPVPELLKKAHDLLGPRKK